MTSSTSAADPLRPRIPREQAVQQICATLFTTSNRLVAGWPVPYNIFGRTATYDQAQVMEYAARLLREAPVRRSEPRQLIDKRVMAELARRATVAA